MNTSETIILNGFPHDVFTGARKECLKKAIEAFRNKHNTDSMPDILEVAFIQMIGHSYQFFTATYKEAEYRFCIKNLL